MSESKRFGWRDEREKERESERERHTHTHKSTDRQIE